MRAKPNDAKEWAKDNLRGIITALIPTFTRDMSGLNEKAIAHDVEEIGNQGYLGASIITEAGTTPDETKQFMEMAARLARGKLLTSLLTTFPTIEQNFEMVRYAAEVGVDMIQLGYPAMWHPDSVGEVVKYTQEICEASSLPTILWAADMWGWCNLLEDPRSYPKELLMKFAEIPNVVGIKQGTKDPAVLKDVYSRGVIPGTVAEPLWPRWVMAFGAQWGGISAYNHLYFCTKYFDSLVRGEWGRGIELYLQMGPMRQAWGEMMKSEVGGPDVAWGWTGHNRLRWKFAGWLVGLNGGPLRGWYRISAQDMKRLRIAANASEIPVTSDEDYKFFEGRKPE